MHSFRLFFGDFAHWDRFCCDYACIFFDSHRGNKKHREYIFLDT